MSTTAITSDVNTATNAAQASSTHIREALTDLLGAARQTGSPEVWIQGVRDALFEVQHQLGSQLNARRPTSLEDLVTTVPRIAPMVNRLKSERAALAQAVQGVLSEVDRVATQDNGLGDSVRREVQNVARSASRWWARVDAVWYDAFATDIGGQS